MAERPLYILKSKRSASGRRHMSIFVPNADCIDMDPNDKTAPCRGTKIHVTGAPMAGFCHEFQRNYNCSGDKTFDSATRLASIDAKYIVDPQHATFSVDQEALGKDLLDGLALRIPSPPLTKNYLDPANMVMRASMH